MGREIVQPTVTIREDHGNEEAHPAWGMIGASRVQTSPPGANLFDSDIRHQHTVVVRISTASRRRHLARDWKHAEKNFVEVEMSEAQWASFVSSMNSGDGVPCTIRRREDELQVPGFPPEARLRESIEEVRTAAAKAFERVAEAMAAYEEKKSAANLRDLHFAIQNAPSNIAFVGDSLTEHAENVVQKARVDIEAMVLAKAAQLGIEPGEVGTLELAPGEPDERSS